MRRIRVVRDLLAERVRSAAVSVIYSIAFLVNAAAAAAGWILFQTRSMMESWLAAAVELHEDASVSSLPFSLVLRWYVDDGHLGISQQILIYVVLVGHQNPSSAFGEDVELQKFESDS